MPASGLLLTTEDGRPRCHSATELAGQDLGRRPLRGPSISSAESEPACVSCLRQRPRASWAGLGTSSAAGRARTAFSGRVSKWPTNIPSSATKLSSLRVLA